jgi:hypothetical protein
MHKRWKAILKVQVPVGMKMFDPKTNAYTHQPTTGQIMEVVVTDAGGYFNTKSLLELQYGSGSVAALFEV